MAARNIGRKRITTQKKRKRSTEVERLRSDEWQRNTRPRFGDALPQPSGPAKYDAETHTLIVDSSQLETVHEYSTALTIRSGADYDLVYHICCRRRTPLAGQDDEKHTQICTAVLMKDRHCRGIPSRLFAIIPTMLMDLCVLMSSYLVEPELVVHACNGNIISGRGSILWWRPRDGATTLSIAYERHSTRSGLSDRRSNIEGWLLRLVQPRKQLARGARIWRAPNSITPVWLCRYLLTPFPDHPPRAPSSPEEYPQSHELVKHIKGIRFSEIFYNGVSESLNMIDAHFAPVRTPAPDLLFSRIRRCLRKGMTLGEFDRLVNG
jgi:hypothetical protein